MSKEATPPWGMLAMGGISASLADVRRGKPVHKGNLHVYLSGSAPLVASLRSDATEVQAEATIPP